MPAGLEKAMEVLAPIPLQGRMLRFYVERRVDEEYRRLITGELMGSKPFISIFVTAPRGFGKTSSLNYWAGNFLRPEFRPIVLREPAPVEVLYHAALGVAEDLITTLTFGTTPIRVGEEVSAMYELISKGGREYSILARALSKLNRVSPLNYMVLVDEFEPAGDVKFVRALDLIFQEPRSIYFTFFGTPQTLEHLKDLDRAVAEKLTVLNMPHFTYEEAREAIRRRLEFVGLKLEEVIPEDDLRQIYAMSMGPRDIFILAKEYLSLGGDMEKLRSGREASLLTHMYSLMDDVDRRIIDLIAGGPIRFKDLQKGTGISKTALWYRLNILMEQGFIQKPRRGVYVLTKGAKIALKHFLE